MNNDEKWQLRAAMALKGRTITSVSFMTVEEANKWDWSKRPLMINLDDGNQMIISQDDEGNDGGSIFTTFEDLPVIPTLSLR
jgi:hypothetical protein|tara:strand:+ start:301 stop:546 length:246 start_codon:yes stop_codon:yes gene_type:complete